MSDMTGSRQEVEPAAWSSSIFAWPPLVRIQMSLQPLLQGLVTVHCKGVTWHDGHGRHGRLGVACLGTGCSGHRVDSRMLRGLYHETRTCPFYNRLLGPFLH